jgi:hypothetical protein
LASTTLGENTLDFWTRTAEGWQLDQQVSNNYSLATTYDYFVQNELPTLVAGCGTGILVTSQLSNNITWSEPDYTQAHNATILTYSHD